MSISYNKEVIDYVQNYIRKRFNNDEHQVINTIEQYLFSYGFTDCTALYAVKSSLFRMVENAVFLYGPAECREFIRVAFGQSEQVANLYSDEDVTEMFKHLIVRDGSKLYLKLKKKYESS